MKFLITILALQCFTMTVEAKTPIKYIEGLRLEVQAGELKKEDIANYEWHALSDYIAVAQDDEYVVFKKRELWQHADFAVSKAGLREYNFKDSLKSGPFKYVGLKKFPMQNGFKRELPVFELIKKDK